MPAWIGRSPAQLPAPRRVKTLEQTIERANKELTGCREQPTSQSAHAAKG